MKNEKLEKQASSEIAQSRESYLYVYVVEQKLSGRRIWQPIVRAMFFRQKDAKNFIIKRKWERQRDAVARQSKLIPIEYRIVAYWNKRPW